MPFTRLENILIPDMETTWEDLHNGIWDFSENLDMEPQNDKVSQQTLSFVIFGPHINVGGKVPRANWRSFGVVSIYGDIYLSSLV